MSESQRTAFIALCLFSVFIISVLAGAPVLLSDQAAGLSTDGEHIAGSGSGAAPYTDVRDPVELSSGGIDNETTSITSNTTFVVSLEPDGDARWTVTEEVNFSTAEHREQFDELATAFETENVNGSELGFDAFVRANELMDERIDRSMSLTDVERSATAGETSGTLTLSFTWENFARTEENQLVLDDVLGTEEEQWFHGLTATQRLVIESPDGFGFADANVAIREGRLQWDGPQTFTNETLQATIAVGNGGETPINGEPPANGNGLASSLGSIGMLLGGLGVLGALGVLVFFAVGRERVRTLVLPEEGSEDESELAEADETTDAGETTDTDGTAGVDETADEDETDVELLSDEERVERLIEQNGGRMKQAHIVKETDWSNAKVSQLLSSMEEEGRIDKLRIGRENLISFPEEDITNIGTDE